MPERKETDPLPETLIRAAELDTAPIEKRIVKRSPPSRVLRAYQDYLDMGEGRSFPKLAEQYRQLEERYGPGSVPTTSVGTLSVWSSKYNWALQIRLDSAHLAAERRAERRTAAREAADRQTQAARLLQQIALRKIREFVTPTGELTEEGKALSAAEARRMLLEGAKLERELAGGHELTSDFGEEISYE